MKTNIALLSQNIMDRSKKTAIILAFLLTAVTSFSFANGNDEINRQIRTSFRQDFKNAQILSSEVHQKFTKLTFKMNEIVLYAFYSDNGRLLAVVRNLLSTQLPVSLQLDLKQAYGDYWITELFELNGDGQNCYYVALENADTKMSLRSTADGHWEVFDTAKKK